MPPDHPALSEQDILARGGWHPRFARVLAVASDGDYGFALVDGNGDGAELEAEAWQWDSGTWHDAGSAGAGPLSSLGPIHTGVQIGDACVAFGRAARHRSITIEFGRRLHDIPVSRHGVWAFIKVRTEPHRQELPSLKIDKNMGTPPLNDGPRPTAALPTPTMAPSDHLAGQHLKSDLENSFEFVAIKCARIGRFVGGGRYGGDSHSDRIARAEEVTPNARPDPRARPGRGAAPRHAEPGCWRGRACRLRPG